MKIELGVGTNPHTKKEDGWLWQDIRPLPNIDVVGPCNNLKLKENSVDEICSHHMIEHIPWEQFTAHLEYWHSLLKPGGILSANCPNGEWGMLRMLRYSKKGHRPDSMTRRVLYGTAEYQENLHHNLFTPNLLKLYWEDAGFKDVETKLIKRHGMKNRDIHIKGVK